MLRVRTMHAAQMHKQHAGNLTALLSKCLDAGDFTTATVVCALLLAAEVCTKDAAGFLT
jgi:hypothetical protein